jgi:hypothetical protein
MSQTRTGASRSPLKALLAILLSVLIAAPPLAYAAPFPGFINYQGKLGDA